MKFIATTYIDNDMSAKLDLFKDNFKAVDALHLTANNFGHLLDQVIDWAKTEPAVGFHEEMCVDVVVTSDWGKTILSVNKTSSDNVLVHGFIDADAADLDDVLYAIAYDGSRHRFQMDIEGLSYDIPKTFDDIGDWETYETSGDEDMLPWETERDFIARIADEFRASQDAGKPNGNLYAKLRGRARVAYDALTSQQYTLTHESVIEQWDRLQEEGDKLKPVITQVRSLNERAQGLVF